MFPWEINSKSHLKHEQGGIGLFTGGGNKYTRNPHFGNWWWWRSRGKVMVRVRWRWSGCEKPHIINLGQKEFGLNWGELSELEIFTWAGNQLFVRGNEIWLLNFDWILNDIINSISLWLHLEIELWQVCNSSLILLLICHYVVANLSKPIL